MWDPFKILLFCFGYSYSIVIDLFFIFYKIFNFPDKASRDNLRMFTNKKETTKEKNIQSFFFFSNIAILVIDFSLDFPVSFTMYAVSLHPYLKFGSFLGDSLYPKSWS